MAIEPLYKSVPQAALRDSALYQLPALVGCDSGCARDLAERASVYRLRSSHAQS